MAQAMHKFAIKLLSVWLFALTANHASAQNDNRDGLPEVKLSGFVDVRAIRSSNQQSWLEGGLGKSRYGADESGNSQTILNLAEASLMIEPKFTWELTGMLHVQFTPEQTKAVDVVEAYLKYKPLSASKTRFSGRLGLLYPPISLEHSDMGWTSPYSLTPSAINSWVGEEVKALTLEAKFERRFEDHTISMVVAGFMDNDTTTSLLAWRGWAMHDQKVSYFQRYPLPQVASLSDGGIFFDFQALWTEPHNELDNKPGYYVGLNWDYLGLFRINSLYYDNRGNPSVVENKQYAWDTDFLSLAIEASPHDNFELLAQYMTGNTKMGPTIGGEVVLNMDYSSYYFMASYSIDNYRVSARYDYFDTTDVNELLIFQDNDSGKGNSVTFAISYTPMENHRIMAEWLHINSDRNNRPDLSLPINEVENQLQLSYRFAF